MAHPALAEAPGDEAAMADALIGQFGAEAVAAAFVRLWREGRSAPEVLSDSLPPPAPSAPRPKGDFGPSVWFCISVGHTGRAEARWLLPKICDAGAIAKDSIGAIRVQQDVTYVQLAEAVAGRFRDVTEIDRDLTMERLQGEPDLGRAERPARAPRPERAERPVYTPKPPRIVEEDAEGAAPAPAPRARTSRDDTERKPYTPRETSARKPYAPREATERKPYTPRESGERKPYAPRDNADRKPYAPREDGERKPYTPRPEGDRKPYKPRAEGDRKPYAPRDGDAKKPYTPRARAEEGDRKPYVKRDDADRKPRWDADKKAKSTAYKSHGGSADKPARSSGYKSHGSDEPAKRTYAPKGDEARPYVKRDSASKASGYKSHSTGDKKTYSKAKPAAPKTDARDTSKRFVPPKKPRT